MPLPIGVVRAADGQSAVPSSALPPGWVFWRVRFGPGAQPAVTATWQFWVGASSATSAVDTSSGAILDVNGDGFADFLVVGSGGMAHLYLGSANPSATDWTADTSARRIDIITPFPVPRGTVRRNDFADVGDVNGDGYGDFLVGSRLYFGSADPSAADWNGASPARALDVEPMDPGAVAGVGDVNGDGYADFLVPGGDAVYLYFGSAKPDAAVWNTPPYALRAKIASVPMSVAGAGDVNGDGYADFLIVPCCANVDFTPPPPRLYLGFAAGLGAEWNAASTRQRIDVLPGPIGVDATGGQAQVQVYGVGDINGDGYTDFMLAALGVEHLFLGSATPQTDDLRGSSSGRIDLMPPGAGSVDFGESVSGAGDIDGDGYADFLVSDADTVHVYFGAAAPTPASWNGATAERRIDVSNPNPMLGSFGVAVAGGGDIDGDGHADFLATQSMGGVSLMLGTATPSATVWTGASATRRIDLTQITAVWVVAAVELIEGALGLRQRSRAARRETSTARSSRARSSSGSGKEQPGRARGSAGIARQGYPPP